MPPTSNSCYTFPGFYRFYFHPLQSSLQAQFLRAEKQVQELNMSVDLMKKETRKLLERAALAEKDMKRGLSELMYFSTSKDPLILFN